MANLDLEKDDALSRYTNHKLFGLTLRSDFPFVNRLVPSNGLPDLVFTCAQAPPLSAWKQSTPAYTSPQRMPDGERAIYLYRAESCDIMHFPHTADFYVWPGKIICHPGESTCTTLIELRLLGPVLSFWLERRGIPALHASAAVIDKRAVAFLSSNSGGKSTLLAAFMQAGYPMLTDDILPVERLDGEFIARFGYPQMRLWPDEARHFLGTYEELPRAHPAYSKRRVPVGQGGFGSFSCTSIPLACIYLPQRHKAEDQTEIEIAGVSQREAIIELVRHSFVAHMTEALGWQPRRLEFFSQLIRTTPVRRLCYPSTFEHLPCVRDAILQDVHSLLA